MGLNTSSMLLLVLLFLGVQGSDIEPPWSKQRGPAKPKRITSSTIEGSLLTWVEGDSMSLKCDTYLNPKRKDVVLQFTFYKDGQEVQTSTTSRTYQVQSTHLEDSGNYHCKISILGDPDGKTGGTTSVVIRELFSSPDIYVTRNPMVEGDQATMTCDTSLHPDRQNTKLHYAFYRDGKKVRGFRSSNKYEVLSAHLEDSGSYYCEVEVSHKKIRKRSYGVPVLIKGGKKNYTLQNTIRLIFSVCLLIILFIIIVYHVKSQD